jgi:hypothetical protein
LQQELTDLPRFRRDRVFGGISAHSGRSTLSSSRRNRAGMRATRRASLASSTRSFSGLAA